MKVARPNRVVRVLAALTTCAYFVTWFAGAMVLAGLPMVKALGAGGGFSYDLPLAVTAPALQTMVETVWGQAPLVVEATRGELQLPIAEMSWSFVALLWSYAAAGGALMLLLLHNLRRLLQRVRDGAAFDVENTLRLRRLGALLLGIAALRGVAEFATSVAVQRGLAAGSDLTVPSGFHVDLSLVPVALVLMVLAEVFRRGTELEDEQSLVV